MIFIKNFLHKFKLWHPWKYSGGFGEHPFMRCCDECHITEEFEYDEGGWTTGFWVPIDDDPQMDCASPTDSPC
jgi:hypothetical protein